MSLKYLNFMPQITILEIKVERNDVLVGVCGEDVRGWSIERVKKRIEQQKKLAPVQYQEGSWFSMGTFDVTDFSLTYIKHSSVNQAITDNLFDRKKVNTAMPVKDGTPSI